MMFQAVASPMYITVNTAMLVVAGSGATSGSSSATIASASRPNSLSGPHPTLPRKRGRKLPLICGLGPARRTGLAGGRWDDYQDHEEDEARPDRRDDDGSDVFGDQHDKRRD